MKLRSLTLAFLSGLSGVLVDARTWTSKEGIQVEGEIVTKDAETVTLKIPAIGKTLPFPIADLIPADQEFLANWGKLPPLNFDAPWPGIISAEGEIHIDTIEEDREQKRFVYHSPHYEFICDVGLKPSLVGKFAKMFEATFQAMTDLPMSFEKARRFESNQRLKIFLFEKREAYFENGGLEGSAGVYYPGKDIVLVPLTSLGVRTMGSAYIIDRDKSNDTLVHELVHQLTDRNYYAHGSAGWFSEGLAEYISNTRYKHGKIRFNKSLSSIEPYLERLCRFSGDRSERKPTLKMPALPDFMKLPYSKFADLGPGGKVHINYGVGMLLVTHFIHFDDGGSRKKLTSFLKAMKKGKRGDELIDILRGERTWKELEEEIIKQWARKKIYLSFAAPEY